MTNIEKISRIDRSGLNNEFYFQALLDAGYDQQLLTDGDIEKIQFGCLELLAKQTSRYNRGESSSVRVEVAETLLTSLLFTISIYLKTTATPDDAVELLKTKSMTELYKLGRIRMNTRIKTAKHLYQMILKTRLLNNNYTYHATLTGGIRGFFKLYDSEFEAQEIHITADYPVFNPAEDLAGIEFVVRYLQSILLENMFFSHFRAETIHHLLCGYNIHYEDLIFNLFEPVLASALGCKIVGIDVTSLNLSKVQVEDMEPLFLGQSKETITEMLSKAARAMILDLEIESDALQAYIMKSLPQIAASIFRGVKYHILERVFIVPRMLEIDPIHVV